MVWHADRSSVAVILGLMPINAVSELALSYSFKLGIDYAAGEGPPAAVWFPILLGACAYGAMSTLRGWQGYLERLVSDKVSMALDLEILETLDSIPSTAHLEDPRHYDRVQVLVDKGRDLAAAVWTLTDLLSVAVRIAFAVILLAAIDWPLMLMPVAAIPVVLSVQRTQPIVFAAERAVAARDRRSAALHDVFLDPTAMTEVHVAGAGAELSRRSDRFAQTAVEARLRAGLRAGITSATGWMIFAAGFALALWWTAELVVAGSATPGDIALVVQLASAALWQVQMMQWRAKGLIQAFEVLDRWKSVLEYAELERSAWRRPGQRRVPERLEDGIALRHVSFTYPGTSVEVLSDLDLELQAGSTIALVGENGAGKSTLVKLLLGHFHATRGSIDVDGTSLHNLDIDLWRARTSATFQEPARIEGDVRTTVGTGAADTMDDDAVVSSALRAAAADSTVSTWPGGLTTPLGKEFQDGLQPSGGQWQRLAIARSLMPANPLLLVLDEPTSAVDALHEAAVLAGFFDAAAEVRKMGGITLFVTHRLATALSADLIVVLENGRLVASGTHAELLEVGGLYTELFTMQAKGYQSR